MKRKMLFVFAVIVVLFLAVLSAQSAQAYWLRIDRDNADSTAYAMGGSGARGWANPVKPGDAAVHYTCSPNCSPVIPFGAYIYFKNGYSVSIPNGSRNPPTPDVFTSLVVNDDGTGTSDPYWIDVYYGRWKFAAGACSCPGVSNSQCVDGSTNSCTNASGYGHHTVSYYYYEWIN